MSSGNDPIEAVLAAVKTVEESITPPSGKTPTIYDEAPTEPNTFPSFINIPRNGTQHISGGVRSRTETIDAILLLGAASVKYSERAQRLWVGPFLDAFAAKLKLGSNVVQLCEIVGWNYDPVTIGLADYIAVTFTLECQLTGAVTVGV